MNNVVYGRTKENLRNRIDVRLVSKKKDYLKWISKQSDVSHVFDNDLAAMPKTKVTLKAKKPAYFGKCILDFSKVLMYEFHYDEIKNKYGNKSEFIFTDTDIYFFHELFMLSFLLPKSVYTFFLHFLLKPLDYF